MKFSHKRSVLSLAVLAALGLGGCSSGGSGSPEEASGFNATTSGMAVKGIVNKGVVSAVELDATQNELAELGTALTEEDGTYDLEINGDYTGGPIKLTIEADADTEMKCDVSNGCGTRTDDIDDLDSTIQFGEWYKPGAGNLSLNALVGAASEGATLSVNITPFSHMAASRAFESATLDEDAVDNANSEVSNLLGIDILNTAPVDITGDISAASSDQVAFAALNAAIANLVVTNANGQPDISSSLDALTDAFEGGRIQASDSGDGISLQDIVTEAESVLDEADVNDTSGTLIGLQEVIDNAGPDGFINPEPGDTAVLSDLDIVKSLVTDLRTWALATDAELNNPTLNSDIQAEVDLASDALSVLENENSSANALATAIVEAVMIALDDSEYDGELLESAVTYSDNVITVTNGSVMGYTINLSMSMPEDGESFDTLVVGVNSGTAVKGDSQFTVDAGLINMDLASTYTLDIESEENLPQVTEASLELDMTAEESGTVVRGALSIDMANVTNSDIETDVFLPTSMSIEGSASNSAVYDLEASWIANVTNLDSVSGLENFADGSFEETESNWIDFLSGVNFDSTITDLPDAEINVSFNRTGLDKVDVETTIDFDERRLKIMGEVDSSDETNALQNTIMITNQDGAVLTLTVSDSDVEELSGTLTFNGIQYGAISEDSNGAKVTYTDGSFEYF